MERKGNSRGVWVHCSSKKEINLVWYQNVTKNKERGKHTQRSSQCNGPRKCIQTDRQIHTLTRHRKNGKILSCHAIPFSNFVSFWLATAVVVVVENKFARVITRARNTDWWPSILSHGPISLSTSVNNREPSDASSLFSTSENLIHSFHEQAEQTKESNGSSSGGGCRWAPNQKVFPFLYTQKCVETATASCTRFIYWHLSREGLRTVYQDFCGKFFWLSAVFPLTHVPFHSIRDPPVNRVKSMSFLYKAILCHQPVALIIWLSLSTRSHIHTQIYLHIYN